MDHSKKSWIDSPPLEYIVSHAEDDPPPILGCLDNNKTHAATDSLLSWKTRTRRLLFKNLIVIIISTGLILFLVPMVTLSSLSSSSNPNLASEIALSTNSDHHLNSKQDDRQVVMEMDSDNFQKFRFPRSPAKVGMQRRPPTIFLAHTDDDEDVPKSFVDAVQSSLNLSVAPCDNFYEYVCGKWRDNNPLPPDQIVWTPMTKLMSQNELVLKSVLEKPKTRKSRRKKSSSEGAATKKARRFYRACIDKEGDRDRVGAEPLQRLIQKIGGWAIAPSNFDAAHWDFQKTLQILHNHYGIPCFFTSFVGPDPRNSSQNIFQIEFGKISPSSSLQKKSSQKNPPIRPSPTTAPGIDDASLQNPQLNYMINIARLLGATNDSLSREMMTEVRMLDLNVHLWTEGKQEDEDDWKDQESLRRTMTLAELKELSPFFYWDAYLNSALESIDATIRPSDQLLVIKPSAFKILSKFLEKFLAHGNQGKVLLSNYMVWQVVELMAPQLSQNFLAAEQQLAADAKVVGYNASAEKWRKCIRQTNEALGLALGAMFIKENFDETQKKLPSAKKMIENIRDSFKTNLATPGSVTWMKAEPRWRAIEKVTAMKDRVGYPEFILRSNELDAIYADFDVVGGDHFGNILRAAIFRRRVNMAAFGQPVQRDSWALSPWSANALYDVTNNQMMIPAGILQPPFFDPKLPPSVNYGSVGTIMGHELTHALDNTGRQFDKFGNLAHWWDPATVKNFNEKSQCMVRQYGNLGIDGDNTLGENIADNGGLKAAYDAYHRQMMGEGAGGQISKNGNLTHDQLFFISMAQIWCTNVHPNIAARLAAVDPHSPGFARGTVPLQNFEEFAKAFNCPMGSEMNPRVKCSVW